MASRRAAWIESLADAVRFAPVRPAAAAGVRAAVATVLPLALGALFDVPMLSWASLSGFLTSIVDKGGAYRTRAGGMASVVVGGAIWAGLAAVAGLHFGASIGCAFVGAAALAFARVYGPAVASAGTCVLVLFLVSLARPEADLARVAERAAFVAGGGLWAMGLALLLWPVRVYRPARDAVGRCLRAVAAFAADASGGGSQAVLLRHRAAIRQSLEDARSTLAATRRGRRGDSGRGERLLIILESTDQTFAAVVAVTEVLGGVGERGAWPAAEEVAARALAAIADGCRSIATLVETEHPEGPAVLPEWDLAALASPRASTPSLGDRPASEPPPATPPDADAPRIERPAPSSRRVATEADYALAAELLGRARALLEDAARAAATLQDDRLLAEKATAVDVLEPFGGINAWTEPWREHFTLRSVVLRHALRVGVTTALAVALAHHFALQRGYWVTISAAVVLQPQLPATFLKALQRVLGTIVGGIVAALLMEEMHDPRAMLATVFVLAVVSVSVLPINYGLYSACLTPTFVLLAEVNARDPGLIKVRIVNTLLGGALALGAARLLWPIAERDLFPSAAASALRAARVYFGAVASASPVPAAELDRARRDFGLAILNAEASFQRWMVEARHRSADLEAPMVVLVYTRGFVAAVVALASALASASLEVDLAPFGCAVDAALGDLEASIAAGRSPQPLGHLDRSIADALCAPVNGDGVVAKRARARLRVRLERVVQALAIQHDAASRWLATLERASLAEARAVGP